MKKIISTLLLFSLCFSFAACDKSEPKEISCEEIIATYENAGYTVNYHNHSDLDTESDVICHIQIDDPSNPERNDLYIDRYSSAEQAETAAKEGKYNIAVWLIFAISGESRWLKSRHYGDIHYHSFNNEIIRPLEKLIKQGE